MSVAIEESQVRARERALAKARRKRMENAARRRRREERGVSKLRRWTAREAQAFEAYTRDPTPAKRSAWLLVWHEQPTFEEAS